jgi:hypothetical protein
MSTESLVRMFLIGVIVFSIVGLVFAISGALLFLITPG